MKPTTTTPAPLLAPERHALITQHLRTHDGASLAVLATLTGSSESTIRRDLDSLSQRDTSLRRTHGGVVSTRLESSTHEPPIGVAERLNVDAKRRIGAAAAALIDEGHCAMFDSGSTVMEAARAAARRGVGMTAITNDLGIAQTLNATPKTRVIVTGGTARPNSNTLYGAPGEALLGTVEVDLLFLGAHAISETGLSESSIEIAEMKRHMINAARKVVLLADSSKFGRRAFVRICDLAQIDLLITDAAPIGAIAQQLKEHGVVVRLAHVAPPAAKRLSASQKSPT